MHGMGLGGHGLGVGRLMFPRCPGSRYLLVSLYVYDYNYKDAHIQGHLRSVIKI